MTFGERLRKMRERTGLPQKTIADALGVERSTYSYYESDRNEPSMEKLRLLAKIFGTNVGALVDDDIPQGELTIADDDIAYYGIDLDKINELSRDEQMLLLYYRRLDDGQKAKFVRKLAEKHDK